MITYRLAVGAYHFGIRIAALLGHKKAKSWLQGRRLAPVEVQKINSRRKKGQPLVWMHAASLGEFEQGKPVLELLRS
ncbi:MAG: glycosyltransferase N-terminal domain-containing protein, partial [Bacteroidota bacterium]